MVRQTMAVVNAVAQHPLQVAPVAPHTAFLGWARVNLVARPFLHEGLFLGQCCQGPKCGRGGRGEPPTTRLAESKVGFFGGWATKSWVFGLVFFLSWLCQCRTTNNFRIGNEKLYFFLMNNPIATSFNKIYINVGSASHITVSKTQLSIVNGKKPNSV